MGGKSTSDLAKYLGPNAALVSYGAMGMAPLSLATSLLIFKVYFSRYWLYYTFLVLSLPRILLVTATLKLDGVALYGIKLHTRG